MKKNKNITVSLCGQSYDIVVQPHIEAPIYRLIQEAEQQIAQLKTQYPRLSERDYLMMYIIWKAGKEAEQNECLQQFKEKLQNWSFNADNCIVSKEKDEIMDL